MLSMSLATHYDCLIWDTAEQVAMFKPAPTVILEGTAASAAGDSAGGSQRSGRSSLENEPFLTIEDVRPSAATNEWLIVGTQLVSKQRACCPRGCCTQLKSSGRSCWVGARPAPSPAPAQAAPALVRVPPAAAKSVVGLAALLLHLSWLWRRPQAAAVYYTVQRLLRSHHVAALPAL